MNKQGSAVSGLRGRAGRVGHLARTRGHGDRPHGAVGAHGSRASVLVVDDEAPALDELVYLLDRIPAVDQVHAASSSNDALRHLQEHRYDVVLLDVRMPSLDGVELAHLLRRFAMPPAIIFVTAYEEYAIKAFEVHASDYLLKPVSHARLEAALERALGNASHWAQPAADEDSLSAIPIETMGRIRLVDRAQVCWVEAEGDYVRLHLVDGSAHLLRMPISHLEEEWSAYGFIRIHRGHLVPVQHITEFAVEGGNHSVTVAGHVLPVSRRHARAVRDRFLRTARKG
jgi:DNA-binding LytR/AlgR family response regulator